MILVVTGGSRGIGAALCVLAAERGYDVVINFASDGRAAEEVASRVRARGRRALTVRGDVSRADDVAELFDAAAELGPLAGVVNNAAITGNTPGRLDEQSPETVRRVLDVNVAGVIFSCQEAVRRLSTRYGGAGGVIVNVSSTAARTGSPGEWTHYAATKAAVETLTVGLAHEVAREGIRVNAVAPGLVDTGLHAAAGMPDRVSRLAPAIPLGRAGQPEEIAEAALWLLSPASSYVTGTVLTVGGGR
ncbi:NAD(P)-dependent dehydrogenase (short-subunit alcohol dehydrogenase family) [Amycolatopsis bartoniae]|uniref:Glucose-1-dehydrogenase n=1 Tax=Amycolatopsis bartoniae TaxID=941986 RepID=A0A8H9IUW5_9PSEU|nr:SDR family oxidoreductase [Amycolatopsis bartoniae]MBB2933003.1 NAD(P)-dependent dehydrogenase (short-subunit alcohol dehydrogenase family) [Amycolatopsis bartoniae]TVT03380.1 SDR family oxidoreductase [Amycolatopsis bartoniae]GHF56303.1 glucose-1-dehydrogenase [Amycolatopsis bartoniae]